MSLNFLSPFVSVCMCTRVSGVCLRVCARVEEYSLQESVLTFHVGPGY